MKNTIIIIAISVMIWSCGNSSQSTNKQIDSLVNDSISTTKIKNESEKELQKNTEENYDEENIYAKIENLTSKPYTYEGNLNQNSEIVMLLHVSDEWVNGKYYYKDVGNELLVFGEINENKIELNEYNTKGKETGIFVGEKSGKNSYNGIWKSKINEKSFPFEIKLSNKNYNNIKNSTLTQNINNPDFKEYISKFIEIKLPFSYKILPGGDMLPNDVRKYIYSDYEFEPQINGNYYYSVAFATDNVIVTLCKYYYMPGVSGIENTFFEIITYDFDGNQIDSRQAGSMEFDQNMGSNELLTVLSNVMIDKDYMITINATHSREMLFEDDDNQKFEETTKTMVKTIKIEKNGKLTENKN